MGWDWRERGFLVKEKKWECETEVTSKHDLGIGAGAGLDEKYELLAIFGGHQLVSGRETRAPMRY